MRRIDSVKNPAVQMLRDLWGAKGRNEHGAYLAEGVKMLEELLASGKTPSLVLADENFGGAALLEEFEKAGADVVVGPYRCVKAASDTVTPQGVLAAVPIPKQPDAPALKRVIALDGVSDPGNVGAIWRLIDAAGWDGLLLSDDSADPYSPKVVRASMGAVLRVPALRGDLASALGTLNAKGVTVAAACVDGDDFYKRPRVDEVALVIGSEARGVSKNILEMANTRLRIPMPGGAQSLNAAMAAAIMVYDFVRINME